MSEDKELKSYGEYNENSIENTEIDADEDDIEDTEDTVNGSNDVNKFSTAYEKETIINFNNAEQNASCYTLTEEQRVNAVERGRALAALAAEKRAAKSNEIDNG